MRSSLLVVLCTFTCAQFVNAASWDFNISALTPQCPSEIYCYGELLHTVQMAKLFPDSKTFVDMKLKATPDITLSKFKEWQAIHAIPTKDDIRTFVTENFDDVDTEFVDWIPDDYVETPKVLEIIKDPDYRQWAKDLNDLWLVLGRKMTDSVKNNTELYSIIYVNNPVIVPGGRFREFYYWDSYWIIRGLLITEMTTTAKGMLENFSSIVERYGFIPNGGRIYYAGRSQPPLYIPMIKEYFDATGDLQFVRDHLSIMEKEFQYWMNNHLTDVNGHMLATYGDKSSGPRPESYAEDVETSTAFVTDAEKEEHYAQLKAAAESGMDFSSRWFISSNGTNEGTLVNLKCRAIVPVELNAILFWNAKILAEFFLLTGDSVKSAEYEAKAQEIFEAVQAVLWHDDVGAWLDWDMINNKPRNYFVPTNLAPLWTKCFNEADTANLTTKVLKYIDSVGIDKYPGGVPNSLQLSGEQWDYPNVWAPMQYLLVVGLNNLKNESTEKMAYEWASRWVLSNFIGYKQTQYMFEKYSADELGGYGGGGEYTVQPGFGWSNGVILDFLQMYGDRLTAAAAGNNPNSAQKWALRGFAITFVAVLGTITTGILG